MGPQGWDGFETELVHILCVSTFIEKQEWAVSGEGHEQDTKQWCSYMGLTDGKMETSELTIKEGHRGFSKRACWSFCLCAAGDFWFIRKD